MIPLGEVVPSRTTPVVMIALAVATALGFLVERLLDPSARHFVLHTHGIVPAAFRWSTLATSLVLHAGWMHVMGNLWFLLAFGAVVEDRLGHGRFLVFYLLGGLLSGAGHVLLDPHSALPLVGASGAVASVLGASLALHPSSRVLTLLPLVVWNDIVEIPAVFCLGLWFVVQLASGVGAIAHTACGPQGMPFWPHVIGLAYGAAAVFVFRRPERLRVEWWGP